MLTSSILPAARPPAAAHLVLLHGFLGAGRNLAGLGRALAARLPAAEVHLVDLPGHGASPPLADGAGLPEVARAVWAALPAPTPALPLVLVGHSLGGRVALAMAALEGGAAARRALTEVVLLDITAAPLTHLSGEMGAVFAQVMAADEVVPRREVLRDQWMSEGTSRALADWAATNLRRDGEAFRWRIDRPWLAAFHRRERACELWPAVAGLGGRCRLLAGGRSDFVSSAAQDRFAALGAEVAVLPAAGHFLHVDAAGEVVDFVAGGALGRL